MSHAQVLGMMHTAKVALFRDTIQTLPKVQIAPEAQTDFLKEYMIPILKQICLRLPHCETTSGQHGLKVLLCSLLLPFPT